MQGGCNPDFNVVQFQRVHFLERNMNDSEAHQAMLERMQMLEEALERAEAGVATEGDWDTIRFECGMPRRQNLKPELRSETWV